MGAITAYAGLMAKRVGYKALYLSGGGVAANSLGMPDLGISTMEDVLTDARRIVDATQMPLLVDIDTVNAVSENSGLEVGRQVPNAFLSWKAMSLRFLRALGVAGTLANAGSAAMAASAWSIKY